MNDDALYGRLQMLAVVLDDYANDHALVPDHAHAAAAADTVRAAMAHVLSHPGDQLALPEVGYTATELATLLNEGADAWAELTEDDSRETESRLRAAAHTLLEARRAHPRLALGHPVFDLAEVAALIETLASWVPKDHPSDTVRETLGEATTLAGALRDEQIKQEDPGTVYAPGLATDLRRTAEILRDPTAGMAVRQGEAGLLDVLADALASVSGDDEPPVVDQDPDRPMRLVTADPVRLQPMVRVIDVLDALHEGWRALARTTWGTETAAMLRDVGHRLTSSVPDEHRPDNWPTFPAGGPIDPMATSSASGAGTWGPPVWETLYHAAEMLRLASRWDRATFQDRWLATADQLDRHANDLHQQRLTAASPPVTLETRWTARQRALQWALRTGSNVAYSTSRALGRAHDRNTGAEHDDDAWDDSRPVFDSWEDRP